MITKGHCGWSRDYTTHGNTEKGVIPKDIRKDLTDDLPCLLPINGLLPINELNQVERVLYAEGINRTTKNKAQMCPGYGNLV